MIREKLNLPLPIILDTKGPEYRIKTFKNGKILLKDGDRFSLTSEDIDGDENRVSVTYKNMIKKLVIGDKILLNNGLIILKVTEITDNETVTKVIAGGSPNGQTGNTNLIKTEIV